jgi:hypothetical protein
MRIKFARAMKCPEQATALNNLAQALKDAKRAGG